MNAPVQSFRHTLAADARFATYGAADAFASLRPAAPAVRPTLRQPSILARFAQALRA